MLFKWIVDLHFQPGSVKVAGSGVASLGKLLGLYMFIMDMDILPRMIVWSKL